MRGRSAIEPVIGCVKADHRMDRKYLGGKQGDANNVVAAGYNFSHRQMAEELGMAADCLARLRTKSTGSLTRLILRGQLFIFRD